MSNQGKSIKILLLLTITIRYHNWQTTRQTTMRQHQAWKLVLLFVFIEALGFGEKCSAFSVKETSTSTASSSRRSFFTAVGTGAISLLTIPTVAQAGIDPTMLKSLPVQGDESGSSQRLRQIEAIQRPSSDLVDIPFEELPSGVSYREYRAGKGDAVVQDGSKVAVELTIRCKSFATATEPGGVKYFSTKDDTEFNELAWTIGNGQLLPGLEEGMKGMRKNALRRIEIPSTQVFPAKKADQLPLPTTKDGKRIFDRLFKTDATILVEVLVTRIK